MNVSEILVMGGVIASVAGVPMGLTVFLLRSIHERISAMENRLRELDALTGAVRAMETKMRSDHAAMAQMERDRRTMVVLSRGEANSGEASSALGAVTQEESHE